MTLQEFYALDEQRSRSPEWDFGVHWIERAGQTWPNWRVSWIVETGELYAIRLLSTSGVRVLGIVPKVGDYPYASDRSWDAWGRFKDAQDIERVMDGWAEEPHRPLSWAIGRLRQHGFMVAPDEALA